MNKDRSERDQLDSFLRMSRPKAPEGLVDSISEQVRSSRPRRAALSPSRVFALSLTLVMLVALASFGGIGYAASAFVDVGKAVTRVAKPAPPLKAIRTPARVQYGKPGKPPGCKRGYARVHRKCVRKGRIVSATLSSSRFASSQAGRVTVGCKFAPKTRHFIYVLTVKKGNKWVVVKSVSRTGSFKRYSSTVEQVFAGKRVTKGKYRLKLRSDSNSLNLSFIIS